MNEPIKWKCPHCKGYNQTLRSLKDRPEFVCGNCGTPFKADDILAQHPPHVKF